MLTRQFWGKLNQTPLMIGREVVRGEIIMKLIKLLKNEIYERVQVIESSNSWYIENFFIEYNKVEWFRGKGGGGGGMNEYWEQNFNVTI